MSAGSHTPKPWVYLNGYAGVGKLTIARELQRLIPESRLVHIHLIVDLCRNIFTQGSSEYETLRAAVRTQVLSAITSSESHFITTYIFTGSHASARQHSKHALSHGVPFISVILHCEEEEHMRRATQEERQGKKLTDMGKLKEFRAGERSRFEDMVGVKEIEVDVTSLQPNEAAKLISRMINTHVSK
ncbi:hypothetical protein M422DRAFT_229085 [Sphaerobolus stellatus SS14]|uniref:APS kinase domain-containing protein n=1 Tax=Sphaerobolus stellatus (strain SS14) TaxID=990650 RepID=A0A0C9VXU4_SPHS4|nr:hypothetical protein M422DRAFT_229085 [Sphaerobolus stellatus SS14]